MMKFMLATACLLGLALPLNGQCDAGFTCTSTVVCTGNTVNFTNVSTGSNIYTWKINEIPFSSGLNATYIFNTAGNQNVELVVSDGASCKDSMTIVIAVNQTPSVNVNVVPLTLGTNDSVHVSFTTNNVLPGASYTWNFCDTVEAYFSTPFYFSWANAGNYCACVQLENPNGCVDNDCQTGITVFFVDGIEEQALRDTPILVRTNENIISVDLGKLSANTTRLYLVDATGKILYQTGSLISSEVIIDRNSFGTGVYFVVAETTSGREVSKFFLN